MSWRISFSIPDAILVDKSVALGLVAVFTVVVFSSVLAAVLVVEVVVVSGADVVFLAFLVLSHESKKITVAIYKKCVLIMGMYKKSIQTHENAKYLQFFYKKLSNSSIIPLEPMNNGDRWCNSVGTISRILCLPFVAFPPVTSTIKAKGLHSYNNLNLPFGLS